MNKTLKRIVEKEAKTSKKHIKLQTTGPKRLLRMPSVLSSIVTSSLVLSLQSWPTPLSPMAPRDEGTPVLSTMLTLCKTLEIFKTENFTSAKQQLRHFSVKLRCLQMPARNAAPLPFGSDPLVRCDINRIRNRIVPDGQAKVSDGTRAILLHQDVLGFQVSVSNARLS